MRRPLYRFSLKGRPSSRVAILLLLCWAFLVSSLVPFNTRSVKAGAPTGNNAKTKPVSAVIQTPRREGELLVRFRAGIPEQQKELIVASHGARRKKILRGESGIEKLELSPGQDVQGVALQVMLDPAVEFAEPNFLISHDQLGPTPNDPRFNEQWSLRNTGQGGGQFGSDIGAAGAWQTTTGTQATVIAVIDSGIDFTHPDLANNQWNNLNPVNGDPHGWDFVTDSGVIKDEQGAPRWPESSRRKETTRRV